nr:hypothetical protein [Pandoravirus aubagnensis]
MEPDFVSPATACRSPPAMEPCVMPPPPSRPWSRLIDDDGGAQEADPHAPPVIAMHVSVGPREPAAVVLFDIDARRPLTCISLPVRARPSQPFLFSLFLFFFAG